MDHVSMTYGGGPLGGDGAVLGSICTENGSVLSLSDSMINNTCRGGVCAYDGGNATITNSIITGAERAVTAGGNNFPIYSSSVSIVNSDLDNNYIGLWSHGGAFQVTNSIISNSINQGVTGMPNMSYSDVWSPTGDSYGAGSDGNISANPNYVNAAHGDYRLNYLSPCIDAANAACRPATDMMGDARYNDPRTTTKTGVPDANGNYPDMGALEFVESAPSNVDLIVSSVTGPATAMAGDQATIQWTDANIGGVTAVGPWHDTVDLVLDPQGNPTVIPVGDVLVGQGMALGSGQSLNVSANVVVPGAVPGRYYWQVVRELARRRFRGPEHGQQHHGLRCAGGARRTRARCRGDAAERPVL